jgi:Tfp pilus assembly protein PilO
MNFMACNQRLHSLCHLIKLSQKCSYKQYYSRNSIEYTVDNVNIFNGCQFYSEIKAIKINNKNYYYTLLNNQQYLTNLTRLVCAETDVDISILPVSIKYLTIGDDSYRSLVHTVKKITGLNRLVNLKSLSIERIIYSEPITDLPASLRKLKIQDYNNVDHHDNNITTLDTYRVPKIYPPKLIDLSIHDCGKLINLPDTLQHLYYPGTISALMLPESIISLNVGTVTNYKQSMLPNIRSLIVRSIDHLPNTIRKFISYNISCFDHYPDCIEQLETYVKDKIINLPSSLVELSVVYYNSDVFSLDIPSLLRLILGLKYIQIAMINFPSCGIDVSILLDKFNVDIHKYTNLSLEVFEIYGTCHGYTALSISRKN